MFRQFVPAEVVMVACLMICASIVFQACLFLGTGVWPYTVVLTVSVVLGDAS
jgi:hypothetical protein